MEVDQCDDRAKDDVSPLFHPSPAAGHNACQLFVAQCTHPGTGCVHVRVCVNLVHTQTHNGKTHLCKCDISQTQVINT